MSNEKRSGTKTVSTTAKTEKASSLSKIIVGLDIGTTKIACFVGKRNEHGKIEILSMGKAESTGVLRGMVANIQHTVEAVMKAVQSAEERVDGNLTIRVVNVGVAGQHIKSLQVRGIHTRETFNTDISQKDINALIDDMYKLVMQPGEEIITVLPQEYIVDNEVGIKQPIGMIGRRLEANFHVITGHVAALMNIKNCVQRAGLEVQDIILEPIASADAVLSDEEKEAGVVLVDIGGGTTDVAIFHEGIIRHTAVIPFGGNIITEDIQKGCTIVKSTAEQLKVEFGMALASESSERESVCIPGLRGREPKEITVHNLANIIQARVEEIIDLVHYEIENSGYKQKLIGGIVVTGGGAELRHITQLFEYITGMDTRIGYPTEHLSGNNDLQQFARPMYATGIGLVMKGFETLDKLEQSTNAQNPGKVTGHTTKTRSSFLERLIDRAEDIFRDNDLEK